MAEGGAASGVRWIDAGNLPGDVVELIDGLGPGEDLIVMRDGVPVAAISSARGLVDEAGLPEEGAEPLLMDYGNVTVVATAMKLSAAARRSLSAELGAEYIVLDMHAAPKTADVLLVPPASPQLIGSLRMLFPKARVVVAEIEDEVLGVSYHGPVRRMLDAGAENYVASTSIPSLAKQLDHAIAQRHQITGGAARLEVEPSQGHQSLE
ncbi:hypothetical protein NLX83_13555 [Allokutzneria sp. A3M-2-11 16]|uniref:hypothetical protein n=1 Tax=Allokutzneria sp. A3M-2-11 16 TaxID=2962043 RepID=UPI0020B8CFAA|nr:hypothetical protein [Allokutzneria sp. A3M-2-11 16]MCP3800284.1 hypothetical protein [Allokutzneria sp. A3M-2-11 16]